MQRERRECFLHNNVSQSLQYTVPASQYAQDSHDFYTLGCPFTINNDAYLHGRSREGDQWLVTIGTEGEKI